MNERELQLRNAEMDYHQKQNTIARRGEALHTAHNMLRDEIGKGTKIDPKEVFKLANQIIKFIEKEA